MTNKREAELTSEGGKQFCACALRLIKVGLSHELSPTEGLLKCLATQGSTELED